MIPVSAWCRSLFRLKTALVAGAALALAITGSLAADNSSSTPLIATNTAHVSAILRDPAQTNDVPARFQGTVIYIDQRAAIGVQDGSTGVVVRLPSRAAVPRLADRVEVEAKIRFTSTNSETTLTASKLTVLGPGKLPEPARPWLIGALNGINDRQWVEVEGVVMQARLEGETLMIHLTDEVGWAVAAIQDWRGDIPLTNWWGAKLKIGAANIGRGYRAIRSPSPQFITVLRTGTNALFAARLVDARQLRATGSNSADRVRVSATVLKVEEDAVFLRSGGVGLRASFLQPYAAGSADPERLELIPRRIPKLVPGDAVEVVGSPLRTKPHLSLSFSSFRTLGTNTPPEPRVVVSSEMLSGSAAHDLVRISGRLLSRVQTTVNKIAAETLRLEDDDGEFQAVLESSRGGQLTFLKTDDHVELTGIVLPSPTDPPYLLRLREAADARSFGESPLVARQRFWRTVGIISTLFAFGVGWIVMLRRQVNQRTTQLRKANDVLQREVEDRKRSERVQHAAFGISEAVHTAEDLKSLYQSIHRIVKSLMPADNFFLLLHDPVSDLHAYAYHVDQKDPWPQPRKVSGGLAGYILSTGQSLLADRNSMTDPANPWHFVSGTPSAVWLGVPLIVRGKAIGVMAVQDYDNPQAYSEEEKQILTYVAEQTALVIERKRSEAALAESEQRLRQSEQRLRRTFDANPAMMTLTRLTDGKFIAANPAFLSAFEYTEAEVIGRLAKDLNLYAEPQQRVEFVELLRKHSSVRDREHRLLTKSGKVITLLVSGEVIQIDGEPHTLSVGIDISTRKQAEQDILRALNTERELGELKSRFVSLVSHEFRTPLGITMSAVELLRNYLDRLSPEKLKELLEDIYSSTLRMSGLMEQVLLLGRVEAGKITFKAAPIDLATLGGKLVDETHSATNRRCPVRFHAEGNLAGAMADESLLRHIFSNLLANAVKYSPDGSEVTFSVQRDTSHAVFSIQDRGIGIPEADHARLFEAFHRASNVGQISGTGLGLMIVKRCVELHRGEISFVSREGEGTTFTVRLPLFETL